MVRLLTVGGSSIAYLATAFDPPVWLKDRYGIDLDPYVEQTKDELKVAPLPERLIGEGAKRIRRAARAECLDWHVLPKLIDPNKCELKCPRCFAGCAERAKWTAREYVEEAVGNGASLKAQMSVEEVLSEGGKVTGVRGTGPTGPFTAEAENVVLAAGGLGTPVIMQASGFSRAGQGLIIDPLIITSGVYPGPGSSKDIPMSCGTTDLQEEGIVMTDVIDPWALYLFGLVMAGIRQVPAFRYYPHTLGIMTKARDGLAGRIEPDGTVYKPISEEEHALLARGSEIATRILIRAGCHPDSIVDAPLRGSHPGATVRIGELVDSDLRSELDGLYVCDASVIPEPMGLPPVLMLIGLGKRLVAEQLAKD
jgi:choline dehydrogenase-like flavoprotein